MNIEMKKLGEFDILSGNLIISDPYLEMSSEYLLSLDNVKVGKWISWAECFSDNRKISGCASLTAKHVTVESLDIKEIEDEHPFAVTTVKGGIGIFDATMYQNDNCIKGERKSIPRFGSDWYVYCLKYIYSDIGAGVIYGGTVSCTSFIDNGRYHINIHKDLNGVVDAIHIKLFDIRNIEITYEEDDDAEE